jgi:TonB-dependent starch-binding outer membrane protein SusC
MLTTLLVVCSLQLQAADTVRKSNEVTVSFEESSLKEIINYLEENTNYKFFYNHKVLSGNQRISMDLHNVHVPDLLSKLQEKTDIRFKVHGDQIVLKKKPKENFLSFLSTVNTPLPEVSDNHITSNAEVIEIKIQRKVTGKVTDESGMPMPGVNVIVKGTSNGSSTDVEGEFSLEIPDDNAVLVFSFIGYTTKEVPVGAQTRVDVQLAPDVVALNEVVVVGYGTQSRTSVTGAISSVNSKEIAALPVPSIEQALQGRVAGVNVVNNGSPGTNPIVRIRGIGSISGSSDPLYVVDGFPTTGLANFDPKDIQSVEVLKDAASAAIYGSRAANGVILITTKSGAQGQKTRVEVDSYYGVQSAWKQLDLLNRDEYLQYGTELINNAGGTLPARFSAMNDPIYEGSSQTYAETETDWQDQMFRNAPINQTQVSITTATDKLKLYSSAGMFNQEGIMIGTDFKRYNYRLNTDIKLSERFKFGQTMTVSYSERLNQLESGGRTILQHVIHQVPYLPVYDPTKLGGYRSADNNDGSDPENPVRIAEMDKNLSRFVKVFGTAYLSVNILRGLNYKFTLGGDLDVERTTQSLPIYNDGFSGRVAHQLQDTRRSRFSPLLQNQLTFDRDFGKHSINVTAVAERQDETNTFLTASAQQQSNLITSLQGGTNLSIPGNRTDKTVLISYLGRINYEYGGKYLLSASIRRDGYSAFAPGHKWGNFPGLSLGWRMSEEAFMSNVEAISDLKLRASYGSLGVNQVGPFDWQSVINLNSTYPFNNSNAAGSYFSQLPNDQLTWETTKMTNFGLDLALFNGKITFTGEYFKRKVDDLILRVPLAGSMGYSVDFQGNVGRMENSGVEFQLGYNKTSGDFRFNATANLGTVTNQVTDLYIPGSTIYRGQNADFGGYHITKTEVGRPVQGFYGWVVEGIFQSQEEIDAANAVDNDATTKYQANAAPGDLKFKDVDKNGVINELDRAYIGSFLPDFTYGLNLSATYKNFDLTLFFQGVQGNEVYNGTKVLSQGMLRLFGAEKDVLDAWTPDNPNTEVPRAVSGDPNGNSRTSDRFVEDGSYLRLKNLNIGYSVPSTTLSGFLGGSITKVRIYVSTQNLLTFTKYSGYDPEIGARTQNNLIQGIDYGQYPQARSIMGGIQLGF